MAQSCPDCNATFTRNEHLQRHMEGHRGQRPFSCGECGAAFSRKDTLSRHMQVHSPHGTSSKHRRVAYAAQACLQCAKSKQRCDGQIPCTRCASRVQACSYPTSGKRRTAKSKQRSLVSGKARETGIPSQALPGPIDWPFSEGEEQFSSLQLGHLSTTETAALIGSPSNDAAFMSTFLGQPAQASEPDLTFFPGANEDFQLVGFKDMEALTGLENYLSLQNETVTLLSPTMLPIQSSGTTPRPTDPVDETPSPPFSEPAIENLETQAPTPSFTQTFEISDSSDKTVQQMRVPVKGKYICQDPEAWRAEDYCHVPRLTEKTYEAMTTYFTRYNRDDEYWTVFTTRNFPPITHINAFIQVYFEDFSSLLPFLHKATFTPTQETWILALGVAAVGCVFSRALESRGTFLDLHEFLRRAIHVQAERSRDSPPTIHFIQAILLNQIGMMFSGDMKFAEAVPTTMAFIETLCRKTACSVNFDHYGRCVRAEKPSSDKWTNWVEKESLRRLFYSAWVRNIRYYKLSDELYRLTTEKILDCQYTCFWSGVGMITIDCLHLPVPCDPSIWDAPSQEAWQERQNISSLESIPLRNILFDFFRTRTVVDLDPFNTLLLCVGVKYYAARLNHAPLYLDILQDYTKTLPSSKLSSAIQDFSHLLALFFYLPVRELYAFSGWRVSREQRVATNAKLRLWIRSNSKARAALVHACSAWSMIRKRQTGAQHEAMGFLFAAVMIWAWIELGKKPQVESLNTLPTVRLDDSQVHLNRWVQNNEDSRLYLRGVGCLWDSGASRRLIHQTASTLESLHWPEAQLLASTLQEHHRSF